MEKNIERVMSIYVRYKVIGILSLIYLISHIIRLTILPPFNDESIYLDWGIRETHIPGMLFYSLYDGKQPFLMWIFGLVQYIISNPLFAGRIVSILFGCATMLGIYFLGKKYYSQTIGVIAALLYCITPLFFFYDRQALMESAVAAIGVWSIFFVLRLFEKKKTRDAVTLGAILGVGYFIKSSALVFLVTFIILACFQYRKHIVFGLQTIGKTCGVFLIATFLLWIRPDFWSTLSLNSRYSLGPSDFTISIIPHIISNTATFFQYGLVLTGFLMIPCAVLSLLFWKKFSRGQKYLFIWWLISISITLVMYRTINSRYIDSILPLTTMIALSLLLFLKKSLKFVFLICCILSAVYCVFLVLLQLTNPISYFGVLHTFSLSDEGYLSSFTSGYGVPQAISYIRSQAKNESIYVGVAENAGNPESAMMAYFMNDQTVTPLYIPPQMADLVKGKKCISFAKPFYFISRDRQVVNLEPYLQQVARFDKPDRVSSIGIYTVKTGCSQHDTYHVSF